MALINPLKAVNDIVKTATSKAQSITSTAVVNKLTQSAIDLARSKMAAGVPKEKAMAQAATDVSVTAYQATQPNYTPWIIGGVAVVGVLGVVIITRQRRV